MPRVASFRGLHYSIDRFGGTAVPERVRLADDHDASPTRLADLTELACPPYDVIDAGAAAELLARNARNAVRLELTAEPDPTRRGGHAAPRGSPTARWRAGASQRSTTTATHGRPTRTSRRCEGVVARVLLEPSG